MADAFDLRKHRRELVLAGILLAVVVAFFYTRAGSSAAEGDGEDAVLVSAPPAAVARAISQISSVKLPSVMLDRLKEEAARYDPTQRNIFRFGNIPPPPPTPEELARVEQARKAAEEARLAAMRAEEERQKLLAQQQANQPPIDPATGLPFGVIPPPPPRPTPPAITLRYSGYLGSDRDRTAVLYSGEDLILTRVGDTINGQFKILDIGYDWVKIGYVDPQFKDDYQKLRMGP